MAAQSVVSDKEILDVTGQFRDWYGSGAYQTEITKRRLLMRDLVEKHISNPETIARFTRVLLDEYAHALKEKNNDKSNIYDSASRILTETLCKENEKLLKTITGLVGRVEHSKEKIVAFASFARDMLTGDEEAYKGRMSETRDGKMNATYIHLVMQTLQKAYFTGGLSGEVAEKICDVNRQLTLRHRDLEKTLEAASKKEPFKIIKAD